MCSEFLTTTVTVFRNFVNLPAEGDFSLQGLWNNALTDSEFHGPCKPFPPLNTFLCTCWQCVNPS